MRRAALLALALGAAGCAAIEPDAPSVAVRRGDFEKVLTVQGTLRAADTVVVMAETQGKVSFMAPEGSVVQAGDPLFGLETTEVEQQLESARLDLAVADAALGKAVEEARIETIKNELSLREKQAQLEFNRLKHDQAEDDLEKKKRQVEARILPRVELTAAELGVEQAALSVRNAEIDLQRLQEEIASRRQTLELDRTSAQARMEKARSQVEENEEYLEKATAKAPQSGIVVHAKNWRGQTLQVGEEVWRNTPVMELPDLGEMEVEAEVNEVDIAQVKVGIPARVGVGAFQDLVLTGSVKEISGLAKEVVDTEGRGTGVHVFDVVIALDSQDPRLRPGMTATVGLVVDTRQDVVLVPAGAVQGTGARASVVLRGGQRVPVTVLATNADEAVIGTGLEPGQDVVLRPSRAPSDAPDPGTEGEEADAEDAQADDAEADAEVRPREAGSPAETVPGGQRRRERPNGASRPGGRAPRPGMGG